MQALKALVIIMGILIIAGMGLLVYGLMTRVSWNEVSGQAEKPLTGQVASFDAVVSTLPAGASVASVSVENDRAVVLVQLPDGGAEIRLFDLETGSMIGTIRLKATQ